MALQSSGAISYSDIKDEFGEPNDKNIGAYRVSKNIGELSSLPLDTGIPQGTSPISFSDFYGKQLNIVVDFHSGGTVTRQNARTQYNNNNVTVIGGFKGKPAVNSTGWQGGKKIIIHVNKLIGSVVHNSNNSRVALRTGAWQSGTDLVIDVGGEGRIWGAGGKGGDGGNNQAGGETGKTGTSALGIEYGGGTVINIANQGEIHRGFGGGGGGGGGHQSDKGSRRYASGGGGGGGQGYPGGPHGDRGNSSGAYGGNGTDGSISAAGNGGNGSNNGGEAEGGGGGEGGWTGDTTADKGGNGEDGGGGNGGGNGAAIRRTSGISLSSITMNNTNRIDGATNQTGVS